MEQILRNTTMAMSKAIEAGEPGALIGAARAAGIGGILLAGTTEPKPDDRPQEGPGSSDRGPITKS